MWLVLLPAPSKPEKQPSGLPWAADLPWSGLHHRPPSPGAQGAHRDRLRTFMPPFSTQVMASAASSPDTQLNPPQLCWNRGFSFSSWGWLGEGQRILVLIPPTSVGIGAGQTDSKYMFINLFRLANSQEQTCEVSKSGDGADYGPEGRKSKNPLRMTVKDIRTPLQVHRIRFP